MTATFVPIDDFVAAASRADRRTLRRLARDSGDTEQGWQLPVGAGEFVNAANDDEVTESLRSSGIACHTHTSRVIHATTSYWQYSHRCFDCSGSVRRQFIERRALGSSGVGPWRPHGVLVGYGCSQGPA